MLNILILIISFISSLAINQDGAKFCNFPKPSSTNYTNTGKVISGYNDFKMQRIILQGSPGTCNPKIPKQWNSLFTVKDGGTVANLILGVAPDGTSADISCMGSCTLKNVWWENACWRAASFRATAEFNSRRTHQEGDSTQYTYIVDGGGALDGFQKIFDQSGPGKTIVKNFCAANSQIILRSCGDCGRQYQRDLTIVDSKFKGPGLLIMGPNHQYQDKVTLRNVSVYGYNNPATKMAFACVEAVQNAANPWQYAWIPGKAGTGSSCNYPASAFKVVN
uniref:Probable pectate lyase F n=1 Tax=Meloidogyne incognita TaxID=6306 RepID=A0A914L3P4_MELIC